ncbi:hypothetical protein LPJ56_003443 [Coemansia sp. RSA 2599]|nr:hypothetical protein LPJ56_003443 [Coemansia sp. RSA 2599]
MVSSPILSPMTAEPLAFLHPLTPSRSESPASPHATTLRNTAVSYQKCLPVPFAPSTRRDSLFGAVERPTAAGYRSDGFDELDVQLSDDDDEDVAAAAAADDDVPFVAALSSWEEGVFHMDAVEVPDIIGSSWKSELGSDSLAFKPGCRPKPWSVRPLGSYDSDDAQIRAIDDDDNEFYF